MISKNMKGELFFKLNTSDDKRKVRNLEKFPNKLIGYLMSILIIHSACKLLQHSTSDCTKSY